MQRITLYFKNLIIKLIIAHRFYLFKVKNSRHFHFSSTFFAPDHRCPKGMPSDLHKMIPAAALSLFLVTAIKIQSTRIIWRRTHVCEDKRFESNSSSAVTRSAAWAETNLHEITRERWHALMAVSTCACVAGN